MQPSFRAVGQTHAEWQTFEKPENKRQMYDSQAWVDWLPYIFLLFLGFSNVCHFHMEELQSRSKSLQPSAAPQPPENDSKISAASHRRLKPPGGTDAAKSRRRRLAFSRRCKLFERDCMSISKGITLGLALKQRRNLEIPISLKCFHSHSCNYWICLSKYLLWPGLVIKCTFNVSQVRETEISLKEWTVPGT